MKNNRVHRHRRLRAGFLASTLVWGGVLAGVPAFAQDQAQPVSPDSLAAESQPQTRTGEGGEAGSDIVVTGSRLIRTDLTAPSPTTVVGEADIKLAGNVTLEKTLNQFPQLGQGNTSNVNNGGGSGVLSANLRGLGATRTLTLVNGRRFIPADSSGNVDLASIPDALIQRVDIVTGGASAVYGSDAIAGAVNFILKDNFEGVEASAYYGINERGDGDAQKYDLTLGVNSGDGRANVAISGSYTRQGSFTQADRDFSRTPLSDNSTFDGFVYSGSGNIPGTRVPMSTGQLNSLVGLAPTPTSPCTSVSSIRFLADGSATKYCQPEDTYNYAPFNLLQRPLERVNLSMIGHYDITDNVTLFAEGYFVDSKNNYELAPDSFTPVTPGGPTSQSLLVPYINNPALAPATAAFFAANTGVFDKDGDGIAEVVGGGRRADELGTRQNYYERQSYQISGGFRGGFKIGEHDWRWEVFGQYMRNRQDTRSLNVINQARLTQALDAVTNAQGQAVCRSGTTGCVPVSIFGLGSITPAAGAFLTPERDSTDLFTRKVFGASLSGALFNIWGGPVAVAVGAEYRKDKFVGTPSPFDLNKEYGPASSNALSGQFDVKEVFGEVRIPILSKVPFFDTLAIEGAIRYSDYSSIGSVVAFKGGGEWAPINWFRIRGAYNRAVRAPNVGELYSAISTGFSSGLDPCERGSAATDPRTDAVKQMCMQQGISAADLVDFHQSSLGLPVRSGGNPNLSEEKSNTYTIGAVLSPPFLRRLNITADYFKVDVQGAITTVNLQQTINDCFANGDINSPTCQAITRLPGNGQIDSVSTQSQNIGSLKVEGIDAQLDYRVPLPGALALTDGEASLSFQAVASWLFKKSLQTLTTTAPQDCAGYYGAGCSQGTGGFILPDFKLNMNAAYNSGPVSWRVVGRMIGDLELYPTAKATVKRVPQTWYVDTTLSFDISKTYNLYFGINNLLDKQPPILGTAMVGDANVDVSLFDLNGRRFFVGAKIRLK